MSSHKVVALLIVRGEVTHEHIARQRDDRAVAFVHALHLHNGAAIAHLGQGALLQNVGVGVEQLDTFEERLRQRLQRKGGACARRDAQVRIATL